jgi:hypothetical protein
MCVCFLSGPGKRDPAVAISTPSAQILALIPFSTKKNRILGEMSDFRARTGKEHDEPKTSCPRNQGSALRMMRTCPKDTGAG